MIISGKSNKGTLNRSLSAGVILLVAVISLVNFLELGFWKQKDRIIAWDVISYYAYLPATFIYDDISLKFIEGDESFSDKFWPQAAENGNLVIKTTMGVSYFYVPWFIAGHITARLTGYEADGYTEPYRFFLQLGGIITLILALWMLRKTLLDYFNEPVTAITLVVITFATNLYYYGTLESTYSHIYSFFLVILLFRETRRFFSSPAPFTPAIIGLIAGTITLIRPSNIIIVLIFLLWNVTNIREAGERIRLLVKDPGQVLVIILFFILPWIPQLMYWKYITGEWFYYSYLDEKFFFGKPHFLKGLFGFRKGLFIYTPAVILMWTGIFFMKDKLGKLRFALVLLTILNSYIIFSWWCWWYGGSFGQRPFIDTYGIYSLPLAAFIHYMFGLKKIFRYTISIILMLLVFHGVFQSFQYYYGAIHWDSMTRASWADSFGRLKPSDRFRTLIKEPDYEKAKATGRE